jgi:hypothetical protein
VVATFAGWSGTVDELLNPNGGGPGEQRQIALVAPFEVFGNISLGLLAVVAYFHPIPTTP